MLLAAGRRLWPLDGGSPVGGGLNLKPRYSIVDIAPSDGSFGSLGCGTWTPGLTPIVTPGQPFGDGTYLVGPEIEPGHYRTNGTPDGRCIWWRLTGFDGFRWSGTGPDDDVAGMGYVGLAGFGAGAIVEIASSDVGFSSSSCGTWSADLTRPMTPGEPFGDGTFVVGDDFVPGRYRNIDGVGYYCEWRRLSGFGGSPEEVIANGDASPIGYSGQGYYRGSIPPLIVEIAPSDLGFYSVDCGDWSPLEPLAQSGQPFGEGTFLVGEEITPGRYQATKPVHNCEWRRFSGFSGTPGDIIEAGSAPEDGLAITAIAPTDIGFPSEGCGTWAPVPP